MYRLLTITLLVLTVLIWAPVSQAAPGSAQERPTGGLPAIEAGADPADWPAVAAEVTAAAVELSRLEMDRDFAALYDTLHPDSRRLVPFAAFAGWYDTVLAGKTTDELTVSAINFIDWTWGVTGETYFGTAQVQVVQPYWVGGVREDVVTVFHLVEDDGAWHWFFGGSQAFIDQQIALHALVPDGPEAIVAAGAAERAERFPDALHAYVDAFWTYQFALAGHAYEPPGGVVGFRAEIETGCGMADPIMEAAFYCVLDETIYYSADFRKIIEKQIGDYGWLVVVAHEWGHHVQLELGADLIGALDQSGSLAPIELEQQADCLAGAYTRGAEENGWVDESDLDEAIYMTSLSGDPVGTSWGDPNAHGSGEDRVRAFLEGYAGGIEGCDLDW
ncbi:MAG: neutral zinc metallopeptidase [Chloroflexota bacterium]|nr:neutral zinc metallopeptidase [Chloroflexota bacterium]